MKIYDIEYKENNHERNREKTAGGNQPLDESDF